MTNVTRDIYVIVYAIIGYYIKHLYTRRDTPLPPADRDRLLQPEPRKSWAGD